MPEILKLLAKENTSNDSVKIRSRAKFNKDSKVFGYTVYFDYFIDSKRKLEYLPKELHFTGIKSKLADDRANLKLIVDARDKKQADLLRLSTGITLPGFKDDFIVFFENMATLKKGTYTDSMNKFKEFYKNKNLSFQQVNKTLCRKFADFLEKEMHSSNSAYIYFQVFKCVLNRAVEDEIIINSPAKGISIKKTDTKKEFLTIEELRILKNTPMPHREVCTAFLFGCFTSMRISDIKALRFDQIKENAIHFQQVKTKNNEILPLNNQALEIIAEQAKYRQSDLVFNLRSTNVNIVLKKWIKQAGINKNISFHCSRVTGAVLMLSNDIPIYTVSKILGHSSVATTEIYSRLTAESKKNAMDIMNKIEF